LGAMRQFVGDKHPTQFMFSAAADEPSRVSLYKRMANKLVNSIPYTMKIIDKSKYTTFRFKRNE
jgi:hypothetical protein